MKIIISESQYSNIFESNNEKQSNLIYKMWNDGMNIYEISELIGLKESQVVIYLKDKHIMVDCGLAYEIVQILYKTSLINKKFKNDVLYITIKGHWFLQISKVIVPDLEMAKIDS